MEGCVDLGVGYMPRWFTWTVTPASSNDLIATRPELNPRPIIDHKSIFLSVTPPSRQVRGYYLSMLYVCRPETQHVSTTHSLVDVAWSITTTRWWAVVSLVRTWPVQVDRTGISPCSGPTSALTSATRRSVWSTPVCRRSQSSHKPVTRTRRALSSNAPVKAFAPRPSRSLCGLSCFLCREIFHFTHN